MKLTKRQTEVAQAKALLYGVEFNGLQEMPGNKAPKYTWTDIVTGGTFLTDTLKKLPEKVRSVRKKFANPRRKKSGAAVKAAIRLSERFHGKSPRFSSKVNLTWPEVVTAIGHCARLDYLSDKFDGRPRIYFHDFEEFPAVYANPDPQPDRKSVV